MRSHNSYSPATPAAQSHSQRSISSHRSAPTPPQPNPAPAAQSPQRHPVASRSLLKSEAPRHQSRPRAQHPALQIPMCRAHPGRMLSYDAPSRSLSPPTHLQKHCRPGERARRTPPALCPVHPCIPHSARMCTPAIPTKRRAAVARQARPHNIRKRAAAHHSNHKTPARIPRGDAPNTPAHSLPPPPHQLTNYLTAPSTSPHTNSAESAPSTPPPPPERPPPPPAARAPAR